MYFIVIYVCIYVCHVCAGDTESEERAGSRGPGVAGGNGIPYVDARNQALTLQEQQELLTATAERSLQALRKAMLFIACLLSV